MDINLVPKNNKSFECKICCYNTTRKSQFDRHTQTTKHKFNTEKNNKDTFLVPKVPKVPKTESIFSCIDCKKEYKYASGLWRHSKKGCNPTENNDELQTEKKELEIIPHAILEYIKTLQLNLSTSNEQIKINQELIVEQHKQIIELMSEIKNTPPVAITNNSNSNNVKYVFNLNKYLYETCKDAITINEFTANLKYDKEDVEYLGNNGYVDGMVRIIKNGLRLFTPCQRPIQCSDVKRKCIHIKTSQTEWIKDDDGNTNTLKKLVSNSAKKRITALQTWQATHPGCKLSNHPKNDLNLKITEQICNNNDTNDNKIIMGLLPIMEINKNV
jgi:hypothetical protein